jgi:tripartite-type tricarboxylate transporter receptor subunit TctC
MKNAFATLGRALLLTAGIVATQAYAADAYPNKPVRIVVGSSPGGVTDFSARLIGAELSKILGQQFVVENRPGAGGLIGLNNVYKADRDGYTILMVPSTLSVANALYKVDFNAVDEFVPIANVAIGPNAISVNSAFPAKDFKGLIDYARTHEVGFASCGPGTVQHLTAEYLSSTANLKLMHIPYKGCGAAITDVLGGNVPLFFSGVPNVIEYRKSGKLRVLAVTGKERDPMMPEVPTTAELGYPQVESYEWFGLVAAKGVPQNVIDTLNKAVNQALKKQDVRDKITSVYMEPGGGTAESFGKLIRRDRDFLGAIITKAGIKLQ